MKTVKWLFALLSLCTTVYAEPAVSIISARQRYPWNGLVDIEFTVTDTDPIFNGGTDFTAAVAVSIDGEERVCRNIELIDATIDGGAHKAVISRPGKYRMVWDAMADLGEVKIDEAEIAVGLTGDFYPQLSDMTMSNASSPWRKETDGSFRSGNISDNQSTAMSVTAAGPAMVLCQWKVSSESGYDKLRFTSLNGNISQEISGEQDWAEVSIEIPNGETTLSWTYSKDGSVSNGSDCGWVKDIKIVNNWIKVRSGTVALSLDARTRIRTAETTETISFDPLWGGSESCEVAIDGMVVTNAMEAGEFVWTRPETIAPAVWTLTHTADGLIYTNYFHSPIYVMNAPGTDARETYIRDETVTITAPEYQSWEFVRWEGDTNLLESVTSATVSFKMPENDVSLKPVYRWKPVIENVKARQRYPWNGLVDIEFEIPAGSVPMFCEGTNLPVAVAVMIDGEERVCGSIEMVGEHINQPNGAVISSPGKYRMVWNAAADLGEVKIEDCEIKVILTDTSFWVRLWENGPYWAECNIGATKPEEPGFYFWWGDTLGYKWENWQWMASDNSNSNFTFYNSEEYQSTYGKDNTTLKSEGWIKNGELASEHDAATAHWGNKWRMPTSREIKQLKNNCTWNWTQRNGVNGYEVRGKGDYVESAIFIPAAGYGYKSSLYGSGSDGSYWSSTPDSGDSYYAYGLDFYSGVRHLDCYGRSSGYSVRAVSGFTPSFSQRTYPIYSIHSIISSGIVAMSLDTRTDIRTANETETITFSPMWGAAESCMVKVNGNAVEMSEEEGDWAFERINHLRNTNHWELVHIAGEEVYNAEFCYEPQIENGIYYAVSNGVAYIIGAAVDPVAIPQTIGDKPVAAVWETAWLPAITNAVIGEEWDSGLPTAFFDGCPHLRSVVLPDGFDGRLLWVFKDCPNLEIPGIWEARKTEFTETLVGDAGSVEVVGEPQDAVSFTPNSFVIDGRKIKDDNTVVVKVTTQGTGTMVFRWPVSSEEEYDFGCLTLDGRQIGYMTGNNDDWVWMTNTVDTAGEHVWTFEYSKDEGDSDGLDMMAVSDIRWTPNLPVMVVNGTGSGVYTFGTTVTVAAEERSADWVFTGWRGDIDLLPDPMVKTASFTMPKREVELTATYVSSHIPVQVRVEDGAGSGEYHVGDRVPVAGVNPLPFGWFVEWQGDTAGLDDTRNAATTLTVPWENVSLRAWYTNEVAGAEAAVHLAEAFGFDTDMVTYEGEVAALALTNGVVSIDGKVIGDCGRGAIRVTTTGNGSLSFRWKVSSGTSNYAVFSRDGEELGRRSGKKADWEDRVGTVSDGGTHVWTFAYEKSVSSASGSDMMRVAEIRWTPEAEPTLEDALDLRGGVTVTTGGDEEWTPVEEADAGTETVRGGSCARSGAVGNDAETWIELRVVGEGKLTLRWKVACEPDPRGRYRYDFAELTADGDTRGAEAVDGVTEWMTRTVEFDTSGEHTVRITYWTDRYESPDYADCVWVDAVEWEPAPQEPTVGDGQGTVIIIAGDAVVEPAAGVTVVDVSVPDGFAGKVVVPSSVETVRGVAAERVVVKGGDYDITAAVEVSAVDGAVMVGEVKAEMLTEAVQREFAETVLDASTESAAVSATPGLVYTMVEGQTIKGMRDGDSKRADGSGKVELKKTRFDESGFYRLKVGK